jgi:hypothetical protein
MKLPRYIFPILIIAALFGGYFLRTAFTQPSTNINYSNETGATATFIVDGLKCKGTAAFFTTMYDSVPGIVGIKTFATEHKAVITYDPDKITKDSIKAIMETPVLFQDGTREQVFKCVSIK